MEHFEEELNKVLNDVIFSINVFMNSINICILEIIMTGFHKKIINNPNYVYWVVSKLLNCEIIRTTKISNMLENGLQISPSIVLGYYRYNLQYELNENKTCIAKKINTLILEQKRLNEFVQDYEENYEIYKGSKLAGVLDAVELFRYIQHFIKI
jgi:hypothetical protein